MSSDIDEFDDTSTFENKAGLAEDMRFLASIPEVNVRTEFVLHLRISSKSADKLFYKT